MHIPGGTPCLVKLARGLHRNLYRVARKSVPSYLELVQCLIYIRDELKLRTEKPYSLMFDSRERKTLPKEILIQHPFHQYPHWKDTVKAGKKGKIVLGDPITIDDEKEIIAQAEELQKQMDGVLLDLELDIMSMKLSKKGLDNTPEVKKAVKALFTFTLKNIRQQTGISINPESEDQKLSKYTEFILYHGAYTVVLDKYGEPTTVRGLLSYPILTPEPGHPMVRVLPAPGLYISVRKYGSADFQIDVDKKEIRKILFGGIGGMMEVHGWLAPNTPHVYQEKLQAYLEMWGYAYPAALVMPSAFKVREITLDLIDSEYPVLVETVVPYMVREIGNKAKHIYENWDEVAKELGEAIVQEAIEEMVKRKVRDFLVKKIGAKLIPLINMVATLADILEADHEFIRNVLAAALVYLYGGSPDDLHISAKTLAKLLTDKFHEEIMRLVINKASDIGVKALKRRKHDTKRSEAPKEELPDDDPLNPGPTDDTGLGDTLNVKPRPDAHAKPDVDTKPAVTADPNAPRDTVHNKGTDLDASDEELRQAQDFHDREKRRLEIERLAKKRTEDAANSDRNKGTGDEDKGTGDANKATGATNKGSAKPAADRENNQTHRTGTDDSGAERRVIDRGKRKQPPEPSEPPLPKSQSDSVEERYEFYLKHRDQYPPHVQEKLDKMKKPSDTSLKELDREIRDQYAQQVAAHLGIPVKSASRIATSGPGGSGGEWEKINRNLRTDKKYRLSITSSTKAGEPVQIDDFDAERRVPIEYKASLDIPGQDPDEAMSKIQHKMDKHGEFAADQGLPVYEWVAHSQHSADMMHEALSDLKGQAAHASDPAVRKKLLDRYSRISIKEEFIFESGAKKNKKPFSRY